MIDNRSKMGLAEWTKVWRGRCPNCGTRLKREFATDESYIREVPIRGRPAVRMASLSQAAFPRANTHKFRITPTYSVCPHCAFRVRRRNISELIA